MDFIPNNPTTPPLSAPYFEDVKASDVPGRWTEKKLQALQDEISVLLSKLGAGGVGFTPGTFPTVPQRFGFRVTFNLNGIPGRIDIAALPIRSLTDVKKDRALAQVLFLFRDYLKAELNTVIYRPGAIPLVPYLIGAGGKTVTETLLESKSLPDMSRYAVLLPEGNK